MRWQLGRQGSGYDKLLILSSALIPFDIYLLRFPTGSWIAPHIDPVDGYKHYRLNIFLNGLRVLCRKPIAEGKYWQLMRSDKVAHSVPTAEKTGWMLSIGWV